jgi:protein-S-isoprenylcysteine O-methyltransferase Ste14
MLFDDMLRVFLACYFLFAGVFYAAKLAGIRHRTGISHDEPGQRGTTQHVAHRVFRLFRLMILGVVLGRVFWPGLDALLIPFDSMQFAAVQGLGALTMVVSFALIVYVHTYMGQEWRSGVGARLGDALLSGGPFAWTRNPMFASIMLGQFGFFLALPSLFSLLCLAVGASAILAQETFEETKLRTQYGEAYDAYAARTPRWWPRMPRSMTGSAERA